MATLREALGRPRKVAPQRVIPTRPKPLDREQIPYWWYPGRLGVELAPASFLERLQAIHPGLSCTKFPIDGTWLLWSKDETVTHYFCPGWKLIFPWQDDRGPLPLDERVFYNLHLRDPRRYKNAVEYFDLAIAKLKEEKDRREAAHADLVDARRRDYDASLQIKNIGAGNKSALHHDGTVVPSVGHAEMLRQRS